MDEREEADDEEAERSEGASHAGAISDRERFMVKARRAGRRRGEVRTKGVVLYRGSAGKNPEPTGIESANPWYRASHGRYRIGAGEERVLLIPELGRDARSIGAPPRG